MSDPQSPTLSDIPQIQQHEVQRETLGNMIRDMQVTGFHRWGFVVYRCTYSDDATWDRYVQQMNQAIHDELEFHGRDLLLSKYFEMKVIDDRATLENASKSRVRDHFVQWVEANQSVDNGGPGTANAFTKRLPMFNYCLYVDQKCLDTVKTHDEWAENDKTNPSPLPDFIKKNLKPYVNCVIIQKDCDPEGEGPDGFSNVEGCTKFFPGWMYAEVGTIPTLYDALNTHELADGYLGYQRPPLVYPSKSEDNGMPL